MIDPDGGVRRGGGFRRRWVRVGRVRGVPCALGKHLEARANHAPPNSVTPTEKTATVLFPLTPVIKNLIILNVLMFIGTSFLPNGGIHLALGYFENPETFRPYQLATHFFMHGGFSHLLFNMLGLYFFGVKLEAMMGPERFLKLFFISAAGALLLYVGSQYVELHYLSDNLNEQRTIYWGRMLGASGGLYGVIAARAYAYGDDVFQLIIPPIPVKVKYLAIIYIGLSIFSAFGGRADGVAHFAHLGGALFGFLLMKYYQKR